MNFAANSKVTVDMTILVRMVKSERELRPKFSSEPGMSQSFFHCTCSL
jgi:hypothetical protein